MSLRFSIRRAARRDVCRHALRLCPALETLEGRAVMAVVATPDLAMVAATSFHSQSVTFGYNVLGGSINQPVDIVVYRSADGALDATAVAVGDKVVSGADVAAGPHILTTDLPGGLPIDPSHPFVLVVADPAGSVPEASKANNTASFRIYVVGVVVHGVELGGVFPGWVTTMTSQLKADGYDVAIPFDWAATSDLPIPGQAVAAGQRLSTQVIQAAATFPAGSVVQVHLIGHSRGAVVVDQAMTDLLATEGADPLAHPGLNAGFKKLTLLDPHPAHNLRARGGRLVHDYSAAPGLVGRVAVVATRTFQSLADDPRVVIPPGVDDSEVYYQHTRAAAAGSPRERTLNLWGDVPIAGATHTCNLTGIARGHSEVHIWYQQNVVPGLKSDAAFVCPAPPRPRAR